MYQLTRDIAVSMEFGGWKTEGAWRRYISLDDDLRKAVKKLMENRKERMKKLQDTFTESMTQITKSEDDDIHEGDEASK